MPMSLGFWIYHPSDTTPLPPSGWFLRTSYLTSDTSFTSHANAGNAWIEVVGGGGAGAAASANSGGGGGGAGGYAAKFLSITPSTSYTYVIGGAGAETKITIGSTILTAAGGATATTRDGALGGIGANGDINIDGGDGVSGLNYYPKQIHPQDSALLSGGNGGSGPWGSGGRGSNSNSAPGMTGHSYGGGGGGGGWVTCIGTDTGSAGGSGSPGIIVIKEWT